MRRIAIALMLKVLGLFGESFVPTTAILRVLALGALSSACKTIFMQGLKSYGPSGPIGRTELVALVVNAVAGTIPQVPVRPPVTWTTGRERSRSARRVSSRPVSRMNHQERPTTCHSAWAATIRAPHSRKDNVVKGNLAIGR